MRFTLILQSNYEISSLVECALTIDPVTWVVFKVGLREVITYIVVQYHV